MGTAITRHCSHPVYMNPPYEPLITLSLLMSNTKQHGHFETNAPVRPGYFQQQQDPRWQPGCIGAKNRLVPSPVQARATLVMPIIRKIARTTAPQERY